MTTDRIQRQIERFLDSAEQATERLDWAEARDRAQAVLNLDPDNSDARLYLAAADRGLSATPDAPTSQPGDSPRPGTEVALNPPESFAAGRYEVKRFLGEGGKKRVYLAHDTTLDRDVAFALIKTEGLDDTARERIAREAQAMGRLGTHPHIVTVFDLGDESGQPYMVTELMGGGDVEGAIEQVPEHRMPLPQALAIAEQVCLGLEFAHGKGIVHRDLKPGNVWLTSDGVAKIGDFGLAVAIDRTRLTQAGMMVGTVSYMPPEQAMGGAVTPRSDLYSLGAMLYELVTGRPPFVGDESVAIIGQHLNTPPVAPTWHRPDCPPGLEALILRLLEKDPNKRPESGAEVSDALASIASHTSLPTSPAEQDRQEPADNPLYRHAFVGRESELRQLQTTFEGALSGRGSLAMVVGEPGIGKTSVCEQLATYATLRGGKTLVGHCYKEGSLSLPYLPFVEAMRSYVLVREPDGLKSDLGSGASEVARIVSEVRDRVQVSPAEHGDPEEQRWRLLQAVTGFLRNASAVQPLLIILEDLHDADRGTLDLLVHLSRNLDGARLLIAGTYRDVEVDRGHPLSSVLAELRRGQNFLRVPLRGLTAEEVQRMMAAVAQREIPWPFAELVHRQTEGNPLFVQEMLRYLVEEGLVAEQGGTLQRVGDDTLAGRIPEGLRDVIGKRLSRLADKTNQVLSIASVVGREFRLDVLQQVANLPQEDVEQALEEAGSVAVVEQRTGVGGQLSFRFTHAFFRQTLYEELFAARRIRLHQQIARALETVYGRRVDEHAAELAEHYSNSSDPGDLGKAVEYGELAAQRAMAVYAYGEAVRHLEQALKAQDVLDSDDNAKRCDLLSTLCQVLIPAGDPRRAFAEVAPAALSAAESLDDRTRAARIAATALHALVADGGTARPEWRRWTETGDRYADPETPMRARVDAAFARIRLGRGEFEEALALYKGAYEMALRLEEPEILFYTAGPVIGSWGVRHEAERLRIAEELSKRSREGVSARTIAFTLFACAGAFLTWGQRERAEEIWREVSQLSARSLDPLNAMRPVVIAGLLALLDGRLEDAVAAGGGAPAHLEEGAARGSVVDPGTGYRQALVLLGRGEEAGPPPLMFEEGAEGHPNRIYHIEDGSKLVLWLAHVHRDDEARRIILRLVEEEMPTGEEDGVRVGTLAGLLETAIVLRERSLVAALAPHLTGAASLISSGLQAGARSTGALTVIARHLGAASALLGDRTAARAYYEQALEVAGRVRFRPEIALTHLQLAELLLEDADEAQRSGALAHLDFAIGEFREMKMQPSLERALRHKEVLKA